MYMKQGIPTDNTDTHSQAKAVTSSPSVQQGQKRTRSGSESGIQNNSSRGVRARRQRQRKPAHTVNPAFDATPSETDTRYIDLTERDVLFGPRPDQLARELTRLCYPCNEPPTKQNFRFRCIASSLCDWTQKSPDRQLARIYKHATSCRDLAHWKPELFAQAEIALAGMASGGFHSTSTPESVETMDPTISSSPESALNPFAKYDPTPNMSHHEQIDHAIARLICDSASPARLIDYPAWGQLLRLIDPRLDYTSPSSTQLRDKIVPAESRRAVLHMREYLMTQTNISLSFDGLTAGEQPVYTVHACTPDRRTFLYHADIFYGSHSSEYIEDLLINIINELGAHRISSIVSDDTNVTRKARRLATARYPLILNLSDPVHKLNLCIQDICRDKLWASVLNRLRKLLTHFKMSTYATGRLNAARKVLGILRGLQSIGKTRFATIYYAAVSVLENLPALYKIYRDGSVDTVKTPLPEVVAGAIDETQVTAMEFKMRLTELVNVLEPLARAILCLESTQSTLSDVYFFWLAALASVSQHFMSKNSLLTAEDKYRLQAVIYNRFNQAMNEAPTDVYLTTFFLDPRYRIASIYVSTADIYAAPRAVVFENAGHSSSQRKTLSSNTRLTESLYSRIRKQLLRMLKHELELAETVSDHPLHQYDALDAKNELITQLEQYYNGLPTFRQFSGTHEGALQYWMAHKSSHFTFILAFLAEKLFSVLPNSMCDERAGSRLTHLYSKLRTRLDAKTMVQQIQFSQFNALIDGSEAPARHRKPRVASRFCEIEAVQLTENNEATEDCPVALSDEEGEDWLDEQADALVDTEGLSLGGYHSLVDAMHTYCINLKARVLIDALSSAPGDKVMDSPEDSKKVAEASLVRLGTYTKVSDVDWDD